MNINNNIELYKDKVSSYSIDNYKYMEDIKLINLEISNIEDYIKYISNTRDNTRIYKNIFDNLYDRLNKLDIDRHKLYYSEIKQEINFKNDLLSYYNELFNNEEVILNISLNSFINELIKLIPYDINDINVSINIDNNYFNNGFLNVIINVGDEVIRFRVSCINKLDNDINLNISLKELLSNYNLFSYMIVVNNAVINAYLSTYNNHNSLEYIKK